MQENATDTRLLLGRHRYYDPKGTEWDIQLYTDSDPRQLHFNGYEATAEIVVTENGQPYSRLQLPDLAALVELTDLLHYHAGTEQALNRLGLL